jgi:lipopolysaccharide export system permease protein
MIKNIFLNFLINGFLSSFLKAVLIFFSLGLILNILEEIEFFKDLDVNFLTPLLLSILYVPSTIIQLLPFIIFIASIWFLLKIRNNKELLSLKLFGYSNAKIFFILALTSFLLGWIILTFISPITSNMIKYYEKTKSTYAKDIDHLVTFNKNGLWIKENTKNGIRIVSAQKANDYILEDIIIFNFNENFELSNKIEAKNANIKNNEWLINKFEIFDFADEIINKKEGEILTIKSIYTFDKIVNLYKNFNTMSFIDLTYGYEDLKKKGYNKLYLDQSLHSMLSLPFFLMIMTALASSLTLNTMKRSNNYKFIIVGLLCVIVIYYFKDLSLALGKTDRIPLLLANWIPVMTVGAFSLIGILQINEK